MVAKLGMHDHLAQTMIISYAFVTLAKLNSHLTGLSGLGSPKPRPLIGLSGLALGLASDWSSLVGGTQKPGLDGLSACTWSLIFYIGIVD